MVAPPQHGHCTFSTALHSAETILSRAHHQASQGGTFFCRRSLSHRLLSRIHDHTAGSQHKAPATEPRHLSCQRERHGAIDAESLHRQFQCDPVTGCPAATPTKGTSPDRYRQDDRRRPRSREGGATRDDRGTRARTQRAAEAGQANQKSRSAIAAGSRSHRHFKEMRSLGSGVSNAHNRNSGRALASGRCHESLGRDCRRRKCRRATRGRPNRGGRGRAPVATIMTTGCRPARMGEHRNMPGCTIPDHL